MIVIHFHFNLLEYSNWLYEHETFRTWLKLLSIVIVCGFLAAETRIAMENVNNSKHPRFFEIPAHKWRELSKVPFRTARYLIGIVTAFVAVVTLGLELNPTHQAVIALIAGLSGNVFLLKHIEHTEQEESNFSNRLDRMIDRELSNLVDEFADVLMATNNQTVSITTRQPTFQSRIKRRIHRIKSRSYR